MRIIPTRLHGLLDYLVAGLLIALPLLADFPPGMARDLPVFLGVATILYSLLTRYEWGLIRLIPMRVHLLLDLLNGLLLAVSPWLFGFHEEIWAPHLIIGCMELAVTAMSIPSSPVAKAGTAT